MSVDWVVVALNAIQQADLSVRERRSARWQLFEVMKASAPFDSMKFPIVPDAVEDIDAIVRDVRAVFPFVKHVGDVVRWLRQRGHPELASRVSRKSKVRNYAGHPDAHLRQAVLRIVDQLAAPQSVYAAQHTDLEGESGICSDGIPSSHENAVQDIFIGDQGSDVGVQTEMGLLNMKVLTVSVAEQGTQTDFVLQADMGVQCDSAIVLHADTGVQCESGGGDAAAGAEALLFPSHVTLRADEEEVEDEEEEAKAFSPAPPFPGKAVCEGSENARGPRAWTEGCSQEEIMRAEGCSQATIDWVMAYQRAKA